MTSVHLPAIAGAGDLVAELAQAASRTGANSGLWPGLTIYRFTDSKLGEFDAVFVSGGHGPMAALARTPDVGRLLAALQAKHVPIAALCHQPGHAAGGA